MNKRSAEDDLLQTSPLKKQQLIESENTYIDDAEDNTTAHTPNSGPIDAESPITVATTPRAKFPSDLKTLICTWPGCAKTFNRPARLRDHLNSHTNSRPFQCPYDDCDKDYIEDKHLKQHIKAVHTHERKHICPREGCGKSFVTGTRLKRHQAVHEGADRFRCSDCGQSFRKRETLNKHIRKEHKSLPPHQCTEPGCAEAFESKGALKRHELKIHGDLKYWCGECGLKTMGDGTEQRVGFTTEALLQAHLKQEHQNCMFCDFKSSTEGELIAHIDSNHSGKTLDDRKTVLCPYDNCTKRFTKKSNLTTHIRSAHEGKRFICGQTQLTTPGLESWSNLLGCGSKFSTKVRLEDHVRYIHMGETRPKSNLSTVVSSPTNLIDELAGLGNHMEPDIYCPNCQLVFKRYHDLNKHLIHAHGPPAEEFASFLEDGTFGDGFATPSNGSFGQQDWTEELQHEEIFAAQMDYGPPHDDWLQDEASIMLLARDSPELDHSIYPALD